MKKGAVLGIFMVCLTLAGAGGYWFFVHRPNQPMPRYIQVKAVKTLSDVDEDKMLKAWEQIIKSDVVLKGLAEQSKIASRWEMSEEAAVEELRNRVFVEIRRHSGLQVGFKGKRKEKEDLDKLSGLLFNCGARLIIKSDPELGKVFKKMK